MRLLLGTTLIGALLVIPVSAATVVGMKIHWSSAGKGAQTVMLVHGCTCDDRSWNAPVPVSGPLRS